jgi:hypothetical protein
MMAKLPCGVHAYREDSSKPAPEDMLPEHETDGRD